MHGCSSENVKESDFPFRSQLLLLFRSGKYPPHRMLLYCFEVKFGQKWQGERVQHGGWPRTTNSLWFVQGLQSQSLCLDPLSNVQQIRFLIPFTKMPLYVQYVLTLLF